MNTTPSYQTSDPPSDEKNNNDYHTTLLVIYSVVLLCGTISLSLMMHILKSSTVSTTSIAVLNLIFAHLIFLFTVPFRIYYYATEVWSLSHEWCKMVSAMIHIHMYMSFILYVIILVTRLLMFYNKAAQVASFQRMHAVICSVLVWLIVLVVVPCTIHFFYGKDNNGNNSQHNNTGHCFKFGKHIGSEFSKVINYIMSTVIIVVALVLIALQTNVLWVLYRKDRQGCTSQQDFGAQLKSLFFALIMVICFIPYHMFRIYYLSDVDKLENINELFLSLTTFNCLDMLTFLGGRTCNMCMPGRAI
ncbi:probable G-protein coupled receptor 141 [Melanotaenia boesemani]|uniref:probable G-protein coupled receptor 141 n=1 Tax=Melanotaenia boesemani TaxID=1250792 RepID=UPI001C058120|nr:probable G-protein coupled receptor 141 [Melanotaenia boesemani]